MSTSQSFSKRATDTVQLDTVAANLKSVVSAAGQLLNTLSEIQNAATAQSFKSFRQTIEKNTPIKFSAGQTCGEPKGCCCDEHLGTVTRTVRTGEKVRLSAKLRNTSDKTRTYAIATPPPLRNSRGETGSTPAISPASMTLAPGQTGLIEASIDITQNHRAGDSYTADLTVRTEGCEPQTLTLGVNVESIDNAPVFDLCCGCDTPVNRLRYYHHFYCDQPRRQRPNPTPAPVDVANPVKPKE